MKKQRLMAFILAISFLSILSPHTALPSSQEEPLTVAESSNFTSTSRYDDVMRFIKELQDQSSLIRVETLCRSYEGRTIPFLILGNPAPASPNTLRYDKRAVIFIQANIN